MNGDDDATIFVVDDDEAVLASLQALLRSIGLRVQGFCGGQEFLDGFVPPRIGCVLLDVKMPGMSGLEVQQRLNADKIDLPVIVVTGYGDVPIAVRAMKAGAVDFIEKPFTEQEVLASIRSALHAHRRKEPGETLASETRAKATALTPREREVLELLVEGHQNKEVAFELGISPRTVEVHRARVMEKMGARTLSALVRMTLGARILPSDE